MGGTREATWALDGRPGLRFRDLRHRFAAIGADLGWSEPYPSKVMGHSSVSFTQRQYGHLFDRRTKMRVASAGLETRFGGRLERIVESSGGERGRNADVVSGGNVAFLHGAATGGD